MVKRWVFSLFLKLSRVLVCLMPFGKEFQRVGATALKDLEANVILLVFGITSKSVSLDECKPCLPGVYL